MLLNKEILLGVNIDHIATLRQARGTIYPDPVQAAFIAEQAGADGITIHLREDRRHIIDRDVYLLKDTIQTRMNLEMAVTDEMLAIAEKVKPTYVCLVPEKREEVTTEGGLDLIANYDKVAAAVDRLARSGIQVSLFIDADEAQIQAAHKMAAPIIELHTGCYADALGEQQKQEYLRIVNAAKIADELGIQVNAGHGLHYHNTAAIAQIPQLVELNIGHAIIANAVIHGLANAVSNMKQLMLQARGTLTK